MRQSIITRFGLGLFSLMLSVLAGGVLVYLLILWQLPDVSDLSNAHMQMPLRVMTHDGQLLAEYGEKQRIPIGIDQVPSLLIQAVLMTEDQRFYQHNGVDMVGIARAANQLIATGRKSQGASTITMQVARNFYLSREKTFSRKLREILLAIKIEHHLTKDQILELYLNKIYFGQRAYGVVAAARNYYGKSIQALSLAEMAMLAGLPQAPSRNNPVHNPKQAIKRRAHVLKRLLEAGAIDRLAYEQAVHAPITARRYKPAYFKYGQYASELARRIMVKQYGKEATYSGGYTVYTTIDAKAQTLAHHLLRKGLVQYTEHHGLHPYTHIAMCLKPDVMAKQRHLLPHELGYEPIWVKRIDGNALEGLNRYDEVVRLNDAQTRLLRSYIKNGYHLPRPRALSSVLDVGDVVYMRSHHAGYWALSNWPKVQGALISVHPESGAIVAMQGGYNARYNSYNHATQAWRQPGSAIKPFIYAAALEKGYTLSTLVNDAPVVIKDSGENFLWRPHNDNHTFVGMTRLREGLVHSTNLISIRVLQTIGIPYARDYLDRFGLKSSRQPKSLSLALGAGTVTPLMLTEGYATFANQGVRVKPYLIEKILDYDGKIIEQKGKVDQVPFKARSHRVLSKEVAFLMNVLLRDVVDHGTGRRAKILHRHDLAGKTGTTNQRQDAWFAGYHPKLLTTVWMGFDDHAPLYAYGAQVALPLWVAFMGPMLKDVANMPLERPKNIVRACIDKKSGLLANRKEGTMLEYFRWDHLPALLQSLPQEVHSTAEELGEDLF